LIEEGSEVRTGKRREGGWMEVRNEESGGQKINHS